MPVEVPSSLPHSCMGPSLRLYGSSTVVAGSRPFDMALLGRARGPRGGKEVSLMLNRCNRSPLDMQTARAGLDLVTRGMDRDGVGGRVIWLPCGKIHLSLVTWSVSSGSASLPMDLLFPEVGMYKPGLLNFHGADQQRFSHPWAGSEICGAVVEQPEA
jgi:hypothetical protein